MSNIVDMTPTGSKFFDKNSIRNWHINIEESNPNERLHFYMSPNWHNGHIIKKYNIIFENDTEKHTIKNVNINLSGYNPTFLKMMAFKSRKSHIKNQITTINISTDKDVWLLINIKNEDVNGNNPFIKHAVRINGELIYLYDNDLVNLLDALSNVITMNLCPDNSKLIEIIKRSFINEQIINFKQ